MENPVEEAPTATDVFLTQRCNEATRQCRAALTDAKITQVWLDFCVDCVETGFWSGARAFLELIEGK